MIEVRRIKARVDDERLPRGADPNTHLKLGRGGLADIEWTVQLLQMRHAGAVPALRTAAHARRAEAAAERRPAQPGDDAEGWPRPGATASRMRNAITLVRGKPGDQLPRDARERAAVARILGYPPGESDGMVNDYLRHHPAAPGRRRAGVLGLTASAGAPKRRYKSSYVPDGRTILHWPR